MIEEIKNSEEFENEIKSNSKTKKTRLKNLVF